MKALIYRKSYLESEKNKTEKLLSTYPGILIEQSIWLNSGHQSRLTAQDYKLYLQISTLTVIFTVLY